MPRPTGILTIVVVAIYVAFCTFLTPEVFAGRFWAEEGNPYFLRFQEIGFWEQLTFTRGYIQIVTNVAVMLSVRAPIYYAPLITTFVGLASQALLVGLLCAWHERLGISFVNACLLAALFVVMPHMGEVWANSTNVHWVLAAVACLILVVPAQGPRSYRAFNGILLFICGLSGPPAAFLTPAFGLKAAVNRDAASTVQFLVLLSTALLHLVLILRGDPNAAHRAYPLDLDLYLSALSTQSFGTLFLGNTLADRLASLYRENAANALAVKLATLALLGTLFAIGLCENRPRAAVMLVAFITSVCAGIFGSIGEPSSLVSSLSGGRYFFVPNVILLLSVAQLPARWAGVAILTAMLAIHGFAWPANPAFFHGPSWTEQLRPWPIQKPLTVRIWPGRWTTTVLPER